MRPPTTVVIRPRSVVALPKPIVIRPRSIVGKLQALARERDPSLPNPRSVVARSMTHYRYFCTRHRPVQPIVTFPRPVVVRGAERLVPTSRPGRGRRNEEGTWGFGAGGISEGFGAFQAGGISKELMAWAPSRNAVSLRACEGRGKKDKNRKLKTTKTQHSQQLLFHFMLVLFSYLN